MLYIKLFEQYSISDIKKDIINELRPLIDDIIDISLDELDDVNKPGKSIIFNILNDDTYIINTRFYPNKSFTDDDIYWANEDDDSLLDVINDLKENKKISVMISAVYDDEDGDIQQMNCGDIMERIQDMYPDIEVLGIFPWDLQ